MNDGWNNTLNFGFDDEGNHVIFNMNGDIVNFTFEESPLAKLQWDLFKYNFPTKEVYDIVKQQCTTISPERLDLILNGFSHKTKSYMHNTLKLFNLT